MFDMSKLNDLKMKSIAEKIKEKGVTKIQVAKMVNINVATLSRIISGKQYFVSEDLNNRIHSYLDVINTDDKNIFNLKK